MAVGAPIGFGWSVYAPPPPPREETENSAQVLLKDKRTRITTTCHNDGTIYSSTTSLLSKRPIDPSIAIHAC